MFNSKTWKKLVYALVKILIHCIYKTLKSGWAGFHVIKNTSLIQIKFKFPN